MRHQQSDSSRSSATPLCMHSVRCSLFPICGVTLWCCEASCRRTYSHLALERAHLLAELGFELTHFFINAIKRRYTLLHRFWKTLDEHLNRVFIIIIIILILIIATCLLLRLGWSRKIEAEIRSRRTCSCSRGCACACTSATREGEHGRGTACTEGRLPLRCRSKGERCRRRSASGRVTANGHAGQALSHFIVFVVPILAGGILSHGRATASVQGQKRKNRQRRVDDVRGLQRWVAAAISRAEVQKPHALGRKPRDAYAWGLKGNHREWSQWLYASTVGCAIGFARKGVCEIAHEVQQQ